MRGADRQLTAPCCDCPSRRGPDALKGSTGTLPVNAQNAGRVPALRQSVRLEFEMANIRVAGTGRTPKTSRMTPLRWISAVYFAVLAPLLASAAQSTKPNI